MYRVVSRVYRDKRSECTSVEKVMMWSYTSTEKLTTPIACTIGQHRGGGGAQGKQ